MKLKRALVRRKPRIEIIPLIDIMFFLLACFMLVSLSMSHMRGVKINLPSASHAAEEKPKPQSVVVSTDPSGDYFLDKEKVALNDLGEVLRRRQAEDSDLRVFVRGDRDALHGEVIRLLDTVRSAGIQKVAFEVRVPEK